MRRLFLLFLLGAAPTSAATLTGTAATRDGQPLAHVPLRLVAGSGARTVMTGAGGRFTADVEPGVYRIESGLAGLVVASAADVRVEEGASPVAVTLVPAPVREHVVVAAARGEAAASSVGVSVSVLDTDRIAERQSLALTQVLQDVPSVAVNRSGPIGRQATLFLRGGASSHTRVLVDGIAVNEPGGYFDYGSLLALEVGQVEVVRGAASSLYGSDALAGVIAVETRRVAAGDPTRAYLVAEGGGFGHRRAEVGASGRRGRFDWNAAGLRLLTDNEGPNSSFRESAGAISMGFELTPRWTARLTARGSDSFHGTPGQTAFGQLDHDAFFERTDVVSSLRLDGIVGRFHHEARLGVTSSRQISIDPADSGAFLPRHEGVEAGWPVSDYPQTAGYQNATSRNVVGYKVEYQEKRHLVAAGFDLERESGDLGVRGDTMLSPERTNVGLYVQDRWTLGGSVFVTAGARLEHNDSFGTAFVPRGALSWIVHSGRGRSTRLKASAGAGIKEPGFFESFGTSEYARGNPDLKPERSRTYDVGLEQRAFDGRARLELTAFHHDYRDQIAYKLLDPVTYFATFDNLGRTEARGLEVELEAQPRRGVRLAGQYTFTDSAILVSAQGFDPLFEVGDPLLRRPRHMASVTAEAGPASGRFTAAVTTVFVGARADSDFLGLGLERNGGYTRVDGRVRALVGRRAELFAVAENLLDAEYHEVLGYEGLGRALRLGVRLRAGR